MAAFAGGGAALGVVLGEGLGGAQGVLGVGPAVAGVQTAFGQQSRPLKCRGRIGRGVAFEQSGGVRPAGA